jgi:hypothetical protein
MAQVQQIYARLFTHIDLAMSLLLKQDLVDAEFVREQNQRIFTTSKTAASLTLALPIALRLSFSIGDGSLTIL